MTAATAVRSFGCVVLLLASRGAAVRAQDASAVAALARDVRVKAALDAAKAGEPQTIEEQIRICQVPAPPFKETARGELIRRAFVSLGLENVRVDRAGNVLGDRAGDAPHPHVVIAAHLDTVFPEETKVTVTRNGTVLTGPGIGDNCRGLAVMLAVVRAMNTARIQTAGPVTFVADVGEEGLGDLRGMKALFGETMKGQVDRFVAIDNAGAGLSNIGVGSHRYRFTFQGPGGHSFVDFGMPNPANALGRAIAKIADLQVSRNVRTTFNVGRVGGGTSVNAIPSDAWMEVDLRSPDMAALASLDGRIQQAVDRAAFEENARWSRPGVVTVVKELVGDRPAGTTAADAPIVMTAQAAARVVGLDQTLGEGSSDANLPMSLGIPAITIGGGGESSQSHAPGESFDSSDSWRGTQSALLLTIALAR